jgi:indole-3-glycerol phosphate synthase
MSAGVLANILEAKREDLARRKRERPLSSFTHELAPAARGFRAALAQPGRRFVLEVKKASPSRGAIRPDLEIDELLALYERHADAVSVLTDAPFFGGSDADLRLAANLTTRPLLRKDFIIDPYQLLEARHAGADAVLLIVALLDTAALKSLRMEAERLGMEALVEVHDESELQCALDSGATLVGVNNRNLRTFEVSLDVSFELARRMPQNVLAVAESGIRTADDLRRLAAAGYRGFLIGEHFMRAPSPGAALAQMIKDSKFQIPDSR